MTGKDIIKARLGFSAKLAELINSTGDLPAFVVADVLASAYNQVVQIARLEEQEILKEIQNADTSVPNDGGAGGE